MRNSFVVFLFAIALFAGCSDDDENGTTNCTIDNFVGVWNMVEQCGVESFQYPLTVTKTATGLEITNLGGLGPNSVVDAVVDGSSFTIAPQSVQGSTFSGNGSLNAGCAQLTINWQGGPNGACGGTATN